MTDPTRHPLISRGIRDSRIRNHMAFHVLVYLVEILHEGERAVYQQSVSTSIAMHRDTVRRALLALERAWLATGWPLPAGTSALVVAVKNLEAPSDGGHT